MKGWCGALLVVLTGCGAEAGDPFCVGKPLETYDTFGRGFLTGQCQGCHASTTAERFGAPVEVVFDTRADAHRWRGRILARAGGDDATMPPAGGTLEDDRVRLEIWLRCFEER